MKEIAAMIVLLALVEGFFSPIRDIILAWKYGPAEAAPTKQEDEA